MCTFEPRADRLAPRPEVSESLYWAAKYGNYEDVHRLVYGQPRPEIDFVYNGQTAPEAAAEWNHVEIVKFLLDNDAKLSCTALKWTVLGDCADVAIYLVEKSEHKLLYLNSVDRNELCEFSSNFLDVLGNPEDRVNDQVSMGNTALHLASQFNHGGCVEWLLDKNTLTSKTNSDKKNCMGSCSEKSCL